MTRIGPRTFPLGRHRSRLRRCSPGPCASRRRCWPPRSPPGRRRSADAGDGRRSRHRPRRSRLVPRHLGDDDGGDDAAFGRADGAHVSRGSRETHAPGSSSLGYLVAWTAFGLVAYGLYRWLRGRRRGGSPGTAQGPYVAGAALALAGLYQLSPLKEACLRHCRGPFRYLVHGWRDGRTGALRMGAEHGAFCVGCCWGLMLALFALGVMSLFWAAVVAAAIFAEKVLPRGGSRSRGCSRSRCRARLAGWRSRPATFPS